MNNLLFHNLPTFTFLQFFQTWAILVLIAFIFFGITERFIRLMPWLAMWILLTPLRPIAEDVVWMIVCWMVTELAYKKLLSISNGGALWVI